MIAELGSPDKWVRRRAGTALFLMGRVMSRDTIERWASDAEFAGILKRDPPATEDGTLDALRGTVGIAVTTETFSKIRAANGMPRLAKVPPDQDALEFELHFPTPQRSGTTTAGEMIRLDILTTREPGGDGAIAKFIEKFGEGIQQVEYEVTDVDRATQILAERFSVKAIYPATRAGADATRVNFFLVPIASGKRILIELVEPARPSH